MILKETILSAFNERGTLLKWLKTVERLITERVLVKPVNNPQSTEIVAVDNTGAQVMLGVGAGLTIDNGVLNAVGGGGGGGTQLYKHTYPMIHNESGLLVNLVGYNNNPNPVGMVNIPKECFAINAVNVAEGNVFPILSWFAIYNNYLIPILLFGETLTQMPLYPNGTETVEAL